MRKFFLSMFLLLGCVAFLQAQNVVKGIVVDGDSENALQSVLVSVKGTTISKTTDANGVFNLTGISNGSYIVEIKLVGYETQNFPVELSNSVVDLGTILLFKDITEDRDLSLITITDDELNNDTSAADNISGLLQATRDVFLRSAAFEFSSSFFRIRGLDSGNGKVLINGIEMNKIYDGRAQWSNWGGLNDVLRNQEFSNGLSPSNFTFGGVLGSTNINTRASQQRPGTRISYSSSNRSYQHRVMATHSTGMLKGGWAMTFSGSRRAGLEGFNDGTTYNAYSLFASIEKKINDNHSLNFTSIFTPNRRGKSSPNTQEVFNLKGIEYNEYWGYLNGRKVNSRIKEVEEPILMLNHFWNISEGTSLQTNVAYQFGKIGNSRLDYNGGANPNPTYYQYLPSSFLADNDKEGAYDALQNFQNDGQLDWNTIFSANITTAQQNQSNAYVLYEDRIDSKQLSINTILNSEITNNITFNSKLEYKQLRSKNFAEVIDLLGGSGYLDINPFADTETEMQNNLLNPNRVVGKGDKFKYNYNINSNIISAFAQAQFKYNKIDFYTAFNISNTSHQREGLYKNGGYPDNSLGKSNKLSFTNYGIKAGGTYKITGRHLLDANVAYITDAPTVRNSFSNPRSNNFEVRDITSQKIFSTDVSYILRSPNLQARVTGFYTKIKDATDIGFFFSQGANTNTFLQEIVTDLETKHFGAELGLEAQITATIKLKGAANIAQYTYDNNPNVNLTSADFVVADQGNDNNPEGIREQGKANLKNYKLAAGPQKAYSVGFEYRDPDYWWFGATANFFDEAYLDISPLLRTASFYKDNDGLPFNNYDPEIAKELLKQEKFDSYMSVNLIGGKSWKIDDKYISLFATVNNLFNEIYKTGGYEQGRASDYNRLKEDVSLPIRQFGPKYWYGRGTTYFLNVNISF
ncbi:TonB-dependent receptor [Polaribacter batillariae]|uniref:TonB-dependent receptor n=1 Tax=Polaribacter batillariae TaxID=2808900 RepID=A0ABX7SV09_9FLAO|nr:TonB-dependent receptor [Polaribacter batillariae]QTD36674.1 TonB-dependent receptor [Polaribacter batillariae]